jgi:rod shape-determining protein MreC|tara:strand:+ start:1108 stop:1905 length:798 start_codon:yes stop_codon:yes gene_type:complete
VFCWWCLPTSVKIFTQSTFREFQAPIWNLTSRVDDLSNYWGHLSDSKKTLIAKGRELSRLNSDLRLQQYREVELLEEIKRIQVLEKKLSNLNSSINLNSSQNFNSVIARISIRKMSSWWQQTTIRKGLNDGFKIGNGVLFDRGIFGRLINVDSKSSEIEILTNPNFRIVAHFAKDSRPVTFQGNGIDLGGEPHGLVMDVPYDMNPSPEVPLELVTSSLGGNFPKGIPIGLVYQLEGGKEGLFKTGKVFIDPKITKVLEVSILTAN